jgi:Membrane MotB of proton-channel complex MotA/MotB
VTDEPGVSAAIASLHDETSGGNDHQWLISYSDMMTLLFGFFVLLYAMADRMQDVQQAAQTQFSAKGASAPIAASPQTPAESTNREHTSRSQLEEQMSRLQNALLTEQATSTRLKSQVEQSQTLVSENTRLKTDLNVIQHERDDLRLHLAQNQTAVTEAMNMQKPQAEDQGGAKSGKRQIQASAKLADGSDFNAHVVSLGVFGVQLDQVPPASLNGRFRMTLSADDGTSVEILGTVVPTMDGETSDRVTIIGYPNHNGQVLRQWIQEKGR